MRTIGTVALCAALVIGPAAQAAKTDCPKFEAGQMYPWQSTSMMPGDKYAWIFVEVDRAGKPIKCTMGENNIRDPETRFRLCRAYSEDWRAASANAGEPDRRTIKRHFTLFGAAHELANQKARKQFFKDNPDERPKCYPE